ncbi:hypothetical protein [Labilibaculum manganireducens]|uniref:Cadherin domain-containing protein n=1 Tax=Labilibaculum manganireducens TaxID=1940525 RepID=A0A2N3HUD8_9BACT|nr:hypothetical protein [Labilibaculum manganireducens]PKQ61648.1 hypothetical protein BZG01_18745 [Labilibaculum manganireducens]
MKTNFTKLLSVCFFLFLGFAASAQTDTRSVGETKAYTVTPESGSNGLLWTLSGTSGTDWNITAGALNSGSITVLWMKPGTYNMTFTETESHTGVDCSTTKNLTVTVNADFDVVIADAVSDCATGSTGNSTVDYTLTKTNGAADWTFDYATTGLTPELSGTAVAVSGNTYTLTLTVPNLAAGADQTFSVTISNVKDSFGNSDNTAGNNVTGDVTIYGVPNTGNITF